MEAREKKVRFQVEEQFALIKYAKQITNFFVYSTILKILAHMVLGESLQGLPHFSSNLSSVRMAKEALYSISRTMGQLQSADPNSVSQSKLVLKFFD